VLKIGDITVDSGCILAPMAGISDLPFRMINRSFGCEFAFAEMISARSLVYRSEKTMAMLSSTPADKPLGVQLLGDDPGVLQRAMDKLREHNFALIDLNAACPVKKVTGKGEGAGLLKEPRKLGKLLEVMVNHADVPVTVKIRAGWDETTINAGDVARAAEDAGVKGLFIHGRTRAQGYRGKVDYEIISSVKKSLRIPVIASGDALSPQLIKRMFDETGCDGVTIARGSLGNPWIFREAAAFLKEGALSRRPGIDEIADTMTRHLLSCAGAYGETVGTILFRKFFAWYTRGIPEIKPLKEKAFRAKTEAEMRETIEELCVGRQIHEMKKHDAFSIPTPPS